MDGTKRRRNIDGRSYGEITGLVGKEVSKTSDGEGGGIIEK